MKLINKTSHPRNFKGVTIQCNEVKEVKDEIAKLWRKTGKVEEVKEGKTEAKAAKTEAKAAKTEAK